MNQELLVMTVRQDRSGRPAVDEMDSAFKEQVSNQVARTTAELRRMEDLLKFGMVDRRVLTAFRSAIDRVRSTGWQVERWLDHDERGLAVLLTEERIRVLTKLATELASEQSLTDKDLSGIGALRESISKLCVALHLNE